MADNKDEWPEEIEDVTEAAEPERRGRIGSDPGVWMRGLWMLVLAVLFHISEWILMVLALLQFFWLLFAEEKNRALCDAGEAIGKWMLATARFLSGESDDKPFPWRSLD